MSQVSLLAADFLLTSGVAYTFESDRTLPRCVPGKNDATVISSFSRQTNQRKYGNMDGQDLAVAKVFSIRARLSETVTNQVREVGNYSQHKIIFKAA